jgi:hypothetical protein
VTSALGHWQRHPWKISGWAMQQPGLRSSTMQKPAACRFSMALWAAVTTLSPQPIADVPPAMVDSVPSRFWHAVMVPRTLTVQAGS